MAVCGLVVLAICAGTYLWVDTDTDDRTGTWYTTYLESSFFVDGRVDVHEYDTSREIFPLTIDDIQGNTFRGTFDGVDIVGAMIEDRFRFECISDANHWYVEGSFDGDSVVAACTIGNSRGMIGGALMIMTQEGHDPIGIDDYVFDFDRTYTPVSAYHQSLASVTQVSNAPIDVRSQGNAVAFADMDVLGQINHVVIIGQGYDDSGLYRAYLLGTINSDREWGTLVYGDDLMEACFISYPPVLEPYIISSTYAVDHDGGAFGGAVDIEGTWSGTMDLLRTDETYSTDVTKVIGHKGGDGYSCIETTDGEGTFAWIVHCDADILEVIVLHDSGNGYEGIGSLYGEVEGDTMTLAGIQYGDDGEPYAVSFTLERNA